MFPGTGTPSVHPGSTSSGLVAGIRSGQAEAWRRLARLYGPLVYGWCRARRLTPSDCDDIVQEVFLTVSARIGDFRREREGDSFRGWLWTITRNKVGDWLRRQRAMPKPLAADSLVEDLPEEPSPAEVRPLFRRALDLVRAECEPRTWQAFWRVVVEEDDPAGVAADLGMTRNAVYVARSRILRRLREVLGDVD